MITWKSYNEIDVFDWSIYSVLPKLRTLRLNGNKLIGFDNIWEHPIKTSIIHLWDNPFFCTCDAVRFAKWANSDERRREVNIKVKLGSDKLTDFSSDRPWLIFAQFLNLHRAQFPKFQKLVCKTGNPLPNTLKSTHLSELLSYPVCKDETLFFSVFDQGLEKMLATNVSGEFILPRDASGPYKVTCLSPTGLPVKIFHREKVNPEPSAVVTRIRREALFSCIGRLVILSLVQRGRSSKSWRSWVKSGAFLHRGR